MKLNHRHTLYACCTGYVTQAVVNCLMPLLFATFANSYGISLDKIGLLITINFAVQMSVDFTAAKYVDRLGYRGLIIFAHFASAAGLLLLGLSPILSPQNIYPALIASIVLTATGGGLIEVLISPMVEALPMENKAGTMSMLHSFYCWGQVAVTLLSTLYFAGIGIGRWPFLPMLWGIIPFINALVFFKVPIYVLGSTHDNVKIRDVFKINVFWIMVVLMVCAGAAEMSMAQWSSYFAEMGLGVSKSLGDIFGPCMFAILMGSSRILHSRLSHKYSLNTLLVASSILCIICYGTASLSPIPLISIAACALCGFSVGIMWPGVYSLAAVSCKQGGTVMFALLALAGDIGCTTGPSIVGYISNALGGSQQALKIALLSMVVFPIVMIIAIKLLKKRSC